MTPEDCLAAGGTFGDNRDDLLHELDNLGGPIDGAELYGAVAVGGFCMSGPECENLSYEECLNSPNCSWSGGHIGGELIITSLKHLDRDVTIGKAIRQKGKRYGFHGSEIGETPLIFPNLSPPSTPDLSLESEEQELISASISSEYPKITHHTHIDIDDEIYTHPHHDEIVEHTHQPEHYSARRGGRTNKIRKKGR
jgi:hypothetical protein